MGDIADMMLEGLLDEETGEYIGDRNMTDYGIKAPGFPVSYERNDETTTRDGKTIDRPSKRNCPICSKLVKKCGMDHHMRDRHKSVEVHYKVDGGTVVLTENKWSFFKD